MYSATDFATDISILLLFLIMNVISVNSGFIFWSKQESIQKKTARPFIFLLCMQQRTRPVIPKEIFLLFMDFFTSIKLQSSELFQNLPILLSRVTYGI